MKSLCYPCRNVGTGSLSQDMLLVMRHKHSIIKEFGILLMVLVGLIFNVIHEKIKIFSLTHAEALVRSSLTAKHSP